MNFNSKENYDYYVNLINSITTKCSDVYAVASNSSGTYISFKYMGRESYGLIRINSEQKCNIISFGRDLFVPIRNLFANERYVFCTNMRMFYIVIGTHVFEQKSYEHLIQNMETFELAVDIWNNKIYLVDLLSNIHEITIDIDTLSFMSKTFKSKIIYKCKNIISYSPEEGHTYSYYQGDMRLNDIIIQSNKLFVMFRSYTDLLLIIINRNDTREISYRRFKVQQSIVKEHVFNIKVSHFLDGMIRNGFDTIK